ncbi:MAG TPA: hypothetical protein VFT78_02990 [Hanamia sp.]|nr:hypothetical protein [Hanamia sp.]
MKFFFLSWFIAVMKLKNTTMIAVSNGELRTFVYKKLSNRRMDYVANDQEAGPQTMRNRLS